MWPIAADVAPCRMCVSVLGAPVNGAKTAEPIKMPFGVYILARRGGNHVAGAHWRHVANTNERSVCGGDRTNYFDHLLLCCRMLLGILVTVTV